MIKSLKVPEERRLPREHRVVVTRIFVQRWAVTAIPEKKLKMELQNSKFTRPLRQ
jgi:hypothetical protein